MTIEVRLSEQHFRNFLIFNILTRLRLYKSPVMFASILTVSAIISFFMHTVGGAILLGVVLLVVGLGVPVVYFTSFFVSLRVQVRQQNLNPPRLVYTLRFDSASDLIEISNDHENVTYRWEDVFHAYHEKDAIYLFITGERAFLIPFVACADKNAVWDLMETKLGTERSTRRRGPTA